MGKNIIGETIYFLGRILSVLRVRQSAGGLEVSDQIIRFAYYDRKTWRLQALRLAPGIIVDGRIKDKGAFRAALAELRSKIFEGRSRKKKVNVVVSLSSANIYNQVFSLPLLSGENLEKAVVLNTKMVSPVDISGMYVGWKVVARDAEAGRCDILSVFIDRAAVDEMTNALSEIGFVVVALESKALVLSRMLREKGKEIDTEKSCVVVNIDDTGINFIIIRKGGLYFEYVNHWRDLGDEKGQIVMEAFAAAIGKGIHQILNFYSQHWQDPVSAVYIAANALYEETKNAVESNVSMPVLPYSVYFDGQVVSPDWFIALGCGARGIEFRREKNEVSLLSISAEETFLRGWFIDFMDFWMVFIPAVLVLSIAILASVNIFLGRQQALFTAQSATAVKNGSSPDIAAALVLANDFNHSVALIQSIEKNTKPKIPIMNTLEVAAAANGVTPTNISFAGDGSVAFAGTVDSQDKIFSFEKTVQGNQNFINVDVPLASIQKQISGEIFSFVMTLSVR